MQTAIRTLGIIVMIVSILVCAFVLPFQGWPLWFAISVGVVQYISIAGLLFFIKG